LYGRESLESGRIEQIVYKYRTSPTVRSIDFITLMHHSKSSIPQVDSSKLLLISSDPTLIQLTKSVEELLRISRETSLPSKLLKGRDSIGDTRSCIVGSRYKSGD
jgi:hypothetical protein